MSTPTIAERSPFGRACDLREEVLGALPGETIEREARAQNGSDLVIYLDGIRAGQAIESYDLEEGTYQLDLALEETRSIIANEPRVSFVAKQRIPERLRQSLGVLSESLGEQAKSLDDSTVLAFAQGVFTGHQLRQQYPEKAEALVCVLDGCEETINALRNAYPRRYMEC